MVMKDHYDNKNIIKTDDLIIVEIQKIPRTLFGCDILTQICTKLKFREQKNSEKAYENLRKESSKGT